MPRFPINSPPIVRPYLSVCRDLKKAIQKLGDSEGLWSFEDKSIQSILCLMLTNIRPVSGSGVSLGSGPRTESESEVTTDSNERRNERRVSLVKPSHARFLSHLFFHLSWKISFLPNSDSPHYWYWRKKWEVLLCVKRTIVGLRTNLSGTSEKR